MMKCQYGLLRSGIEKMYTAEANKGIYSDRAIKRRPTRNAHRSLLRL
jgi:hypothetical protein